MVDSVLNMVVGSGTSGMPCGKLDVVGDFCWIQVDPGGDSSQIFCKVMIGNDFKIY